MTDKTILWEDKKRTLFGLPLSFTKYILQEEKLLIKTGFLSIKTEEIRLYRIMDITLLERLGERIWGLGTLHICSADKSTPEFEIKQVKRPQYVNDLLSEAVENERNRKRIAGNEFMGADDITTFHE